MSAFGALSSGMQRHVAFQTNRKLIPPPQKKAKSLHAYALSVNSSGLEKQLNKAKSLYQHVCPSVRVERNNRAPTGRLLARLCITYVNQNLPINTNVSRTRVT